MSIEYRTVAVGLALLAASAAPTTSAERTDAPPASPENSYLSCETFAARADGEQPCRVRVAVHDAHGRPLVGRRVRLLSDRGEADRVSPLTAETDDAGRAHFTVRSEQPGVARLRAVCGDAEITTEIASRGAVAIYTFDGPDGGPDDNADGDAAVRDLSGHGNHGTLIGDPTFVPGRRGRALLLNGVDQGVRVPNDDSMSGAHGNYLEAWIKPAADVAQRKRQVIAEKSHEHGGDYALNLQGRKIAYHYRSSQRAKKQLEEALSDREPIEPEVWTLAAGFWEGSDVNERVRFHGYVRAYASGDAFEPRPWAQQVEGIWNGRTDGDPFQIGLGGEGNDAFHGLIDEVRVYDRALYDAEMRRNHAGVSTVAFGLSAPADPAIDDQTLPECVSLSWTADDPDVTTYRVYRSTQPDVAATAENLLRVLSHERSSFRDYEVDAGTTYYYRLAAGSMENESAPSPVLSATPRRAPTEERWYLGDGHFHTYTHDVDVADFTPEDTLLEAKKLGWDFVLVTEHNSLGSFYRAEDQGTPEFIVIGNGQEISNGGDHRTGAFLSHFIPTSDTSIEAQNRTALEMGGQVGPNHSAYRDGPPNITLFELVNNKKWYPFDAWDDDYLKRGIHVTAKGGSDAHGRWSVKRGLRWCVWADRLSYRAIKEGIAGGRTLAVDGPGLLCMLKVNDAMIGDTVRAEAGSSLRLDLSARAEEGVVSEVKLVRYGETLRTWTPNEPTWSATLTDEFGDRDATYYRLEVRSTDPDRRAVSSAIFVETP